MHYVLIAVVLLFTHALAAVLGMVFKNRTVAALKTENDQLKASANRMAAKAVEKL